MCRPLTFKLLVDIIWLLIHCDGGGGYIANS